MPNYRTDRDYHNDQARDCFALGEKLAELGKLDEALTEFESAKLHASELSRVHERKRDGTDYDTNQYWSYDSDMKIADAWTARIHNRIRVTKVEIEAAAQASARAAA